MKLKPIAFYLPQFHPIPENDEWWGEGFTEWSNVKKAKPLFKQHNQPRVPTELGYYDLREEEIRIKQAELAKSVGIHGFCYWHYWFGAGKRLLEGPAQDFLKSGKPDFPICFAWANQTWTGIWHGAPGRILKEQQYLGVEDDRKHFEEMLPYFHDSRYIMVEEKPLFLIYRPFDHPYLDLFLEKWDQWAKEEGLKGVYFLGISYQENNPFKNLGGFAFHDKFLSKGKFSILEKIIKKVTKSYPDEIINRFFKGCHLTSYKEMVKRTYNGNMLPNNFPTVFAGWDNTPRSGKRGVVQHDFGIELFENHLEKVLKSMNKNNEQIFFIKSWNEWAEGNYLEPDELFGYEKLMTIKKVLKNFNS